MLLIAVLPIVVMFAVDVKMGLVLSIGVIPAAVSPLSIDYRHRLRMILVGVLFSASVVVGSFLSQSLLLAVIGVGALTLAGAYMAATRFAPISALALGFCLPIMGIGFSYPNISEALGLGLVVVIGSLWAYLVSLLFKGDDHIQQEKAAPSRRQAANYGLGYSLAAVIATVTPLALGWDHVGWVAGATLFVMRPSWEAQKMRMIGRIASVSTGALFASLILWWHPDVWLVAIFVTLAMVLAGATQGSKWYIMPAFTTFIVFFVLLYVNTPDGAVAYRFSERILETAVGVVIACVFGVIIRSAARHTRS